MKRILPYLVLLLGLTSVSYAISDVWLSTHSVTGESAASSSLCNGQSYLVGTTTITVRGHAVLHSICINDSAAGTLTVYNSSGSAVNTLAVIRSTAAVLAGCSIFDVQASSGLSYANSAGTDFTMMYNCY